MMVGALAGAAGLAMRPWETWGQEKGVDGDRIVLLSDVHIDVDRAWENKDKVNPWNNLAAAVKEIVATGPKSSPVLITGDLARLDGQAGDYATLIDAVRPMREAGSPVHMILGITMIAQISGKDCRRMRRGWRRSRNIMCSGCRRRGRI